MNKSIIAIVGALEVATVLVILLMVTLTYQEVKVTPADVNRDGEVNTVDLSVLMYEINQRTAQ